MRVQNTFLTGTTIAHSPPSRFESLLIQSGRNGKVDPPIEAFFCFSSFFSPLDFLFRFLSRPSSRLLFVAYEFCLFRESFHNFPLAVFFFLAILSRVFSFSPLPQIQFRSLSSLSRLLHSTVRLIHICKEDYDEIMCRTFKRMYK